MKNLLLEYVERLVRHIGVEFGYHFKWCVHCQYGYADVDGLDVEVCHIEGNCAAAAEVHATEFAVLPDYLLIVEKVVNFSHILCVGVRCAAFATVSGEFGDNYTVIDELRIVALKNFGERWVEG